MASETPRKSKHSTWYQVHTDISTLNLWCDSCTEIIFSEEGIIPCPHCGGEAKLRNDLTPEHIDIIMGEIEELSQALGDYDVEEEMYAHKLFESYLQGYDWWYGDRCQIQFVWYELSKKPCSVPGYFDCALRYFSDAYKMAYHLHDY
jgi:hypothetical protein